MPNDRGMKTDIVDDTISRQAAIDAVDSETVSTNPDHFKSSEKFIKFMDDADIASFGKWQWANGFNTALVASKIRLEKLPPAQPERKTGHWIKTARWGRVYYCDQCRNYLDFGGVNAGRGSTNFCPNCGANMKGEQDD